MTHQYYIAYTMRDVTPLFPFISTCFNNANIYLCFQREKERESRKKKEKTPHQLSIFYRIDFHFLCVVLLAEFGFHGLLRKKKKRSDFICIIQDLKNMHYFSRNEAAGMSLYETILFKRSITTSFSG